jgi:hypothetical protein
MGWVTMVDTMIGFDRRVNNAGWRQADGTPQFLTRLKRATERADTSMEEAQYCAVGRDFGECFSRQSKVHCRDVSLIVRPRLESTIQYPSPWTAQFRSPSYSSSSSRLTSTSERSRIVSFISSKSCSFASALPSNFGSLSSVYSHCWRLVVLCTNRTHVLVLLGLEWGHCFHSATEALVWIGQGCRIGRQ